jgi:hypothetical protein
LPDSGTVYCFLFPLTSKKQREEAGKKKKDFQTLKLKKMANWCFNTVEFIGEHSQFEQLEKLFNKMKKKEEKERKGQLPDFVHSDDGYFFECSWEGGILYYNTRWAPNTDNLKKTADHFGVGFTLSYAETGNLVYGEASYKDGILTDVCLDNEDFDLYEFDEEQDTYLFEGNHYESSDEIMKILLQRKKAISALTSSNNL